jgi:hypothetical protein
MFEDAGDPGRESGDAGICSFIADAMDIGRSAQSEEFVAKCSAAELHGHAGVTCMQTDSGICLWAACRLARVVERLDGCAVDVAEVS